ncbi:hypothetical protein QJS04_geneDACA014712 [Acorus gramineus]|uniref:Uncharacterized protein n=1 Tax=Acorus gramineus TaxID=55184 RepID=A0AAV9B3R7_ACOGR|nr:hypothetical protein QJS04_geneDACA014712 [Acorus gramineus]
MSQTRDKICNAIAAAHGLVDSKLDNLKAPFGNGISNGITMWTMTGAKVRDATFGN